MVYTVDENEYCPMCYTIIEYGDVCKWCPSCDWIDADPNSLTKIEKGIIENEKRKRRMRLERARKNANVIRSLRIGKVK